MSPAERLADSSRKLGMAEGAEQQDRAMRWPYRAQGFIVGVLFASLCLIPMVKF